MFVCMYHVCARGGGGGVDFVSRMLTYANVCWRMLTYADAEGGECVVGAAAALILSRGAGSKCATSDRSLYDVC